MTEMVFAQLELFGVRQAGGEAGLGLLRAVGAMGMLLEGKVGCHCTVLCLNQMFLLCKKSLGKGPGLWKKVSEKKPSSQQLWCLQVELLTFPEEFLVCFPVICPFLSMCDREQAAAGHPMAFPPQDSSVLRRTDVSSRLGVGQGLGPHPPGPCRGQERMHSLQGERKDRNVGCTLALLCLSFLGKGNSSG